MVRLCGRVAGAWLGVILFLLPFQAFAEGASVGDATAEERASASEVFREGRAAFDDRRFADAMAKFRASYDIVASPNTLLMVAHCLEELGRVAEAYRELSDVADAAERAAAIDPKYASSADLAREEQAALRSRVALLRINVPEDGGATLKIDGRDIRSERWGEPIAVDPGKVSVVYASGERVQLKEIEMVAGGEGELTFAAGDDTGGGENGSGNDGNASSWPWQSDGTQRAVAFALTGLGAAALIGAGVMGGVAVAAHDDLVARCGVQPCAPDAQSDIDQGRAFRDASNGLLISGLITFATGVTLFFTAPDSEATESAVWVDLGAGSATVKGTF